MVVVRNARPGGPRRERDDGPQHVPGLHHREQQHGHAERDAEPAHRMQSATQHREQQPGHDDRDDEHTDAHGSGRAPRWCDRPSPSRMPTCPVPSANSVGSDIQLRTTLAVPSVKSQPNPRPLAQPISAITATDTAVSDPPAMRNALNVPPQRQARAIATKPSGQQRRQLDLRGQRDQHDAQQTASPAAAIAAIRRGCCGQASGFGSSGSGGVDAAQRELGARQHQAQHQRLVVDARDQMHEQQRVAPRPATAR